MDLLAVSGPALEGFLVAGAVAVVAALGAVALGRSPRLALAVWLVVLCAVPVWVGVSVVVDWEAQVLVTVSVLTCLVAFRPRTGTPLVGRVTLPDLVVGLFVVAALVPVALDATTFSDVFVLLAQWTGAFLLGRLIGSQVGLDWAYAAVAVAFTVVAVLALVEFATGWNPFVQIPGQGLLHADWSPIQERGGRARAEGAFGHSIALGAGLAMAIPLTLAAPFRAGVRVPMAMLLAAAAAVTFSRTGLVTAVLGAVLLRVQGMSLLAEIRGTIGRGRLPARALADAMLVGIAGVLLLTPGYFTDLLGILLLIPPVRSLSYGYLRQRFTIVTPASGPRTIDLDAGDFR